MLTLRKAEQRGHANFGWLNSYHTFSFGNYYDPTQMGFRGLRAINEDRVAGGSGFGKHPHQDMEIISYVIDGALEHQDSIGTSSVIQAGEVQRMSAGTGIYHSEYNPSENDPVHFLQIWIPPVQKGLEPSYEQKHFSEAEKRGRLRLIVSPDGRDNSLTIHQDAYLYATVLAAGEQIEHTLTSDRHAWIQVVKGEIAIDTATLTAGDGAAISHQEKLAIEAKTDTEFILFDLA